jgi:hypothetical protein
MEKLNPQLLIDWLILDNHLDGCGCGAIRCTYLSKSVSCTQPTNCLAMTYAKKYRPRSHTLFKLLEEECKN